MIDCFDSKVVGAKTGRHPTMELAEDTLEQALENHPRHTDESWWFTPTAGRITAHAAGSDAPPQPGSPDRCPRRATPQITPPAKASLADRKTKCTTAGDLNRHTVWKCGGYPCKWSSANKSTSAHGTLSDHGSLMTRMRESGSLSSQIPKTLMWTVSKDALWSL